MATGQLGAVFRQIGRLFGPGTISGLTEAQLLSRFVERRDEAAFEALVSRFGPMVLGVCRQVLADPHAADDAFQATFLVLVKRARSIRDRDLLGNWLYGVALKVARRSRADVTKRRAREMEGQPVAAEPIGNGQALDDLELGPILHEELAKLPEKYRAPMVLCYLDGQTCEEAAGRLGWPVGTVKGRLSRAKDILRQRLARRGVTASAAIVAATLTKAAEASVSPFLLDQTVKAAMVFAAGGALAAAGLGSAAAVALAEGANATMILTKWKTIALAVTLVGTLAGGAAVMARQGLGGAAQEGAAQKGEVAKGLPNPGAVGGAAEPLKGGGAEQPNRLNEAMIAATPLPDARTPEAQLLAERSKIANQNLISQIGAFEQGTITMDRVFRAAERYMDARVQVAGEDRATALKAVEDYVRFNQIFCNREKAKFEGGVSSRPNLTEAELNLAEAKILLAKARSGQEKPEVATKSGKVKNQPPGAPEVGGFGGMGGAKADEHGVGQPAESDDPDADKKIMAELAKPLSMPFTQETPLEEVIKYIKTATINKTFEQGLPIYVDPEGLQTAEKTMSSPITLSLEGIKLKTSLRLMLKQLSLGYYVKHGLLIITNYDDEEYKDATQSGWRAREVQERAHAEAMGGAGGGFR